MPDRLGAPSRRGCSRAYRLLTESSIGKRTAVFALVLTALGGWFVYDSQFNDGYTLFGALGWLATPLDWLFMASVVVFAVYVVHPLATDRALARRYWRRLRRRPETVIALGVLCGFFVAGAVGPSLAGRPELRYLYAYQPPAFGSIDARFVTRCAGRIADGRCHGSLRFPWGTDRNGFGIGQFALSGLRVSLYVAFITSMFVVPIGVAVGTAAGYYGGPVDSFLMRYAEIQETVPALVVYMFLFPITGESLFVIIVLFGFLGWGGIARRVRSDVRQRRQSELVTAAKSAGGSDLHIVRVHVLPNVSNTIVAAMTQQIPVFLLTEAGIAFLGFESADVRSLGKLIARGVTVEAPATPGFPEKWWVATIAAVTLALVVVAFELVGDALRDAADPRTGD